MCKLWVTKQDGCEDTNICIDLWIPSVLSPCPPSETAAPWPAPPGPGCGIRSQSLTCRAERKSDQTSEESKIHDDDFLTPSQSPTDIWKNVYLTSVLGLTLSKFSDVWIFSISYSASLHSASSFISVMSESFSWSSSDFSLRVALSSSISWILKR